MNRFEAGLKSTLNDEVSITENGAAGFKTSGKKLLDLNFAVSSLRSADESEIEKKFSDAFYEDPKTAVKWLFFARDVREGMGERRLFRTALKWLATAKPEVVRAVIPAIMEYGRADDMLVLSESELWNDVVKFIDDKLAEDRLNLENRKPISLLAKWLPSINTSSIETRALGTKLRRALNLTEKQYRKLLASLRAKLNVTEVDASANRWNEIDYNMVPSKANLKYKNAFLKHDEARRRDWLSRLENEDSSAKVNVGALTAPDIVVKYLQQTEGRWYYRRMQLKTDSLLESAWKALPTTFKDNRPVIAVVDGSGSMTTPVGNGSSITCLTVANALGIYFAERLSGPFKNKFITFSEHPQYVDLTNCVTLAEKLSEAFRHDECANTDVEATMRLILETAVRNNLSQDEIPDVCVFSDMEFDQGTTWSCGCANRWGCADSNWNAQRLSLFEGIRKQFEAHGYKLPRISYWNIRSRTKTIPLQENELGVSLISGFSQNVCKMIMSNKLDPYEVLIESLEVERYRKIDELIAGLF